MPKETEHMVITRETLSVLMESMTADEKWNFLVEVKSYVQEILDELAED